MRTKTLEDKEDIAMGKEFAWNAGFRAGQIYGLNYSGWLYQNTSTEEPKNPWVLLLRHYTKRWKRGER